MAASKEPTSDIQARFTAALEITNTAALKAMALFYQGDDLVIESKGVQDWVSNADKEVETQIRDELTKLFSDDTIIGEEHDNVVGKSPYSWIIDPIDGTASFVNGVPGWCVVLACVKDGKAVIGVIVDPIAKEVFSACEGGVASLNGKPIKVSDAHNLTDGSVAVGHCARHDAKHTLGLLENLISQGGVYYRIGSGALMLAYVAAGRLLGYVEAHMYAWDCVAGLFIIEEAGGKVEPFDMDSMIASGGSILTAGPNVYDKIAKL